MFPGGLRPDGLPAALSDPRRIAAVQATGLLDTEPALIRRADGRVYQIDSPGSLLGIVPDISLADVRFRLAPGDVLLLYTDGATEAREQLSTPEAVRPLFGEDALADALASTHGLDAAATISRLAQILARHTGGWASDDTALLALRVPPRP
jgi:serine phosphatase RsbU (regulator of sigma subunit)